MTPFAQSVVEQAALAWLERLGRSVLTGSATVAGELGAERSDPGHKDVILERRLRDALGRQCSNLRCALWARSAVQRLAGGAVSVCQRARALSCPR